MIDKLIGAIKKLAPYRKGVIGAVGFLAELIIQLGVGGEAQKWATIIIGALTALGVYSVRNAKLPSAPVQ
jgi:hypothetical protein